MTELKIGDTAPDFRLPTENGEDISSSSLKGHKAVIYFYPKDNTPGCTTQACDFRDHMDDLGKLNAKVVGISKDSVQKHKNFKTKNALNFPLASDENSDICEKFGVWKEKKLYGKTFMGIERSTFLLDEEGRVLQIWRKVKVKDHIHEIHNALKTYTTAAR